MAAEVRNVELHNYAGADELAEAVAQAWLTEITAATPAGRPQFVALSGGRITLKLFAATIAISQAQSISLAQVHFFWADERCVPPADKESSFGTAQEAFFVPLGIAAEQIHRVLGEETPERATELAIAEIKRSVPLNPAGQPMFDLLFLGMGEDGHVASLFPREAEEERMDPAICRTISNSPKPPPDRVTLGYSAIAAAKQVWVLASGAGKEAALRKSLQSGGKTPLGRVLELRSLTRIYTDLELA